MITHDKNPNEFCTSQQEDLHGGLFDTRRFAVQIEHGDFPRGKGHSFKLFRTEESKSDAHFELQGEQKPIVVGDITRLKVTNEKVDFDLFAHRNWKRALVPIGVLCASVLILKSHSVIRVISSVVAFCSAGILSTSIGKRVRFLCDLKDGRYFTATMPAVGYEVLRQLVEG